VRRAYGYEAKLSVALTRHLALNGGLTKMCNAFFTGGDHRVYVDSAPHFVANAALTLAGWHGWSRSLRMRAINHYRLDGDDPSIVASGHTVFDLGMARQIHRGVEFNLSLDFGGLAPLGSAGVPMPPVGTEGAGVWATGKSVCASPTHFRLCRSSLY
jgi:hypothetical protein